MGKKNFYSYSEALVAAKKLGIKSGAEYNARYREDPKLPAIPYRQYATVGWVSWYEFLGREKPSLYKTYSEAQAAVRRLGIKKSEAYPASYREDPRLPASPSVIYADIGWIDWYEFLGNEKTNPYETYTDAQAAAQKLGIKTREDHLARYHEDPRLPASPGVIYASSGWIDWYDFLGNEKSNPYTTYSDAQAATQNMGITSKVDYNIRYREDSQLPGRPDTLYANTGWKDWFDFLGKERSPWYSYEEAQAACWAMDIKNGADYGIRYKEDPKLPSTPNMTYANTGWTGWLEFLGKEKVYSYAEAQIVCRAMGIKNSTDYSLRYQEDPRLHAVPERTYHDCGWTNWYEYIGNGRPIDPTSDYPNIAADVDRWLKNETAITRKRASIRALLNGYIKPLGLPDDSKYLLLRANPFNVLKYQQMIEAQAESAKKKVHFCVSRFFEWLLLADCTDEDNGERIVLREYRNPFSTALAGYEESLSSYRPSQSTKPPLGYEYILRARNFLVPNGEAAMLTRPTLKDLPHLHEFFASRIDWISVDELMIDRSDPNCIYREFPKAGSFQIWSPVRFVALYTLLRFPLRGQQILWLDSGEADEEIAVLDDGGLLSWKKNGSNLPRKRSKNRRPQAAVQRGDNSAPKLHVTSNKTGQKIGGYDVDWIPDDLVYWFLLLRDWQAKFNPILAPTPWTSIKLKAETNVKILTARKDQCFLFRMDASGQPFMPTAVFAQTLPALLYKIQRKGEDLAKLDRRGNRFISPYTPHSLRVSLITAFIVDGNAPIHLISKLVGHASLVMTIYYTKLNSEQMRRPMGEVEKTAAQRATERSADAIRVRGLNALNGQLIATDGNRSLIESETPTSACIVFDWGICPKSAAACNMGGEVLIERQTENIYSPVEAGYLGQKNCTRCRFFVTGVPFLGGLVALANEIALEITTESARYQDYTERLDNLEQEHYDACQAGTSFPREQERKFAVANQQQSAGKLDVFLSDYAAIHGYVASCLKLINQNESNSSDDIRLVISGDIHEMGVAYQESTTSYHLLAEICQNATIYQSANPSRAVPLIADAIDRMAENNNLAPAMFKLNSEQKLVVANELNRLLLQRLGSWEKIDELFSGDLMLLDVDANEPELTRVSTEVRQLLSKPNSVRQISHEVSVYG
ncbi:Site-specific recombinase XerC [Pseudomonas sp. 24 E 13]|uniref:VPA1269 family protein n=1 Tax=Pseudomonas sp. 24 E 13 TaxID=1844095 RepID=UPI00081245A6|nr:VPA1269 family protein [Pseudomonas sp. 24 E 13]CRM45357.1 Site-specific recombinase XerC [Pseudomonas sp. 24 E 13]